MHEDSVLPRHDTLSVDNLILKSLLLQHSEPWKSRNSVALKQWDPISCWFSIISQKDGILSNATAKTSTHICTGLILETFQRQCFGNWSWYLVSTEYTHYSELSASSYDWNYLLLTAKTAYQWLQITYDFYCNMFWSSLAQYHWNIPK